MDNIVFNKKKRTFVCISNRMKCRLHDSSRLQESYCFLQKFNIILCNYVCALFFNEERERIKISDPMFCDMITKRKAKCVLYYNAKTLPVSIIGTCWPVVYYT